MQVETETTISIGDALDEIHGDAKVLEIESSGGEVLFIRVPSQDDHRDGFLVNAVVPVIEKRETVVVEEESVVREVVAGAETARVIRINETPWSPLYEDG